MYSLMTFPRKNISNETRIKRRYNRRYNGSHNKHWVSNMIWMVSMLLLTWSRCVEAYDDDYAGNFDEYSFDNVSLMPVSCINLNNGHMIKFQLFENNSNYQCHLKNLGTFVVSVAHYMRAFFNYQALVNGRDFQLPGDVGYLNCVLLQATAYADTKLYAKIGCMNKETFTSTKLQLHLYRDRQCTYPYMDGNSDHYHSAKGYDVNGYLMSSKVSFRPPFYSCQGCKPSQISSSFSKKYYWYDDDYINTYHQKQSNDDAADDYYAQGDDAAYNNTNDVDDQYFVANDDGAAQDDFYAYRDDDFVYNQNDDAGDDAADDGGGGGGGDDDAAAADDGGGGDDYAVADDGGGGDDYAAADDGGGGDDAVDDGGGNDDGSNDAYYSYDDDNNRKLKYLPRELYASEADLQTWSKDFWNEINEIRRLNNNVYNWNMCDRVYKYGMWCDADCRALDTFRVNQWSHSDIFLLIIMCVFMSAMMLLIFAKRVKAYEKASVYGDELNVNFPGLPPMAMLLVFISIMTITLILANLKFVNETLVFSVVVCILLFIYMLKLTLFENRGPHLLPPVHRSVALNSMNRHLFDS